MSIWLVEIRMVRFHQYFPDIRLKIAILIVFDVISEHVEMIRSMLGLPRLARNRRMFHGDRDHVAVNPSLIYDWVDSFRSVFSAACSPIFDRFGSSILSQRLELKLPNYFRYEEAVNKFGYSLVDPLLILDAPILEPYLIHLE